MTFAPGDQAVLAEQLGGATVEVVDMYRQGIYQVRLPGCSDFVISTHVLRPVTEADVEPQHVIEFRADGWTIMHPLSCRPRLFECPVNRAAEQDLTEPPTVLGRFECNANDLGDRLLIGDRIGEPA